MDDVPKMGSSNGACRATLPVPISLKGFGHNLLASRWYTGRGARMRWPRVNWPLKRKQAVWRGAARGYTECLQAPCINNGALGPSATKCHCYAPSTANASASRAVELARLRAHHDCIGCQCKEPQHPRTIAVRTSLKSMAMVDAAFTPCSARHSSDCALPAKAASGAPWRVVGTNASPIDFGDLANYTAVMELDGFGWQASTLSKLTLGSVVVAQETLYPLWYDPTLISGRHLIRSKADLIDLLHVVQELNNDDVAAQEIARAGRQRACEIMHLPHLASYISRLMTRYTRLFTGSHSSHLHHKVRHIASDQSWSWRGTRQMRMRQPEELWAELGVIVRCGDIWWRDPRCKDGALNTASTQEK